MKKIYTPVLIEEKPLTLPAAGEPISVPVENMNWFANLNAYECRWEIGGQKGKARADVAPSSKGVLSIPAPTEVTGDETLTLEWYDETGRMVDAYKLRFKEHEKPKWQMGKAASIAEENGRYLSGANAVYLKGNRCEIALDKISGGLMWALKDNEQVLSSGPTLHVLNGERPTADDPRGWKFTGESHEAGLINWNGVFGSEYEGGYRIRMDEAGQIEVAYEFKYKGPDIYAREVGLQWELPLAFDRLDWDRAADHSVYPADHIGRPTGTALAHLACSPDRAAQRAAIRLGRPSLGQQRFPQRETQHLLGFVDQQARARRQGHFGRRADRALHRGRPRRQPEGAGLLRRQRRQEPVVGVRDSTMAPENISRPVMC